MRANGGVNTGWGYTHWWKMFNPRQLIVHTSILRELLAPEASLWPIDVRENALVAFQQFLRNHCMFAFWHVVNDVPVPHLSNDNYHPKANTIENNFLAPIGYGNWASCVRGVVSSLESVRDPWESLPVSGQSKAEKVYPGDPVPAESATLICSSATDLQGLEAGSIDLVVTDPPFGNNVFYGDLADFFYVWLRIALLRWYAGLPERAYFEPARSPHALEAVENPVEHPDDREVWEKGRFITAKMVGMIRDMTGDQTVEENAANPLYRPEPASDFYKQTLTACWAEAGRLLKPGGIMAFTFHHSEDAPWLDVLEALFNAGYILVATYPVSSDDTKGETGAFGSRKIEYDIIHVCRKRLQEPQPVSWARMRRWVREEALRLKELLEHSHGQELTESDLRVILRGKSLEFYSRHYGQVYSGANEILGVRDALLGINQLLDDILEEAAGPERRAPEEAEPASRLFLRTFQGKTEMPRDELHKTLRGTGISQGDLESHGWICAVGTTVDVLPVAERFAAFRLPGRTRRVLKTDVDQAQFLIGAAMPGSGLNIETDLDAGTWRVKKGVDAILDWYTHTDPDRDAREAAERALQILQHWRSKPKKAEPVQVTLFDQLEEEDE